MRFFFVIFYCHILDYVPIVTLIVVFAQNIQMGL